MIGTQMSGFQDIYEVTENLGEPSLNVFNKRLFQPDGTRTCYFCHNLHYTRLSVALKYSDTVTILPE